MLKHFLPPEGLMYFATMASLVMSPVHCLFGLHIVRRGVIFIDLAVAQVAALGMSVAIANGHEIDSSAAYWTSLGFALGAALLIALTRFKLGRVPHEAIIGIIFVVGSALGLVVLQGTPHGAEELSQVMSGTSLLLVAPQQVNDTAIIYAILLVIAVLFWRQISRISLDEEDAPRGLARVFYDFVFYGMLAFVVASSVKLAGVLVVFTWLVMPPVVAFLWVSRLSHAVWISVPLALIGSLIGLWVSLVRDWPPGASIVIVFGCIVALLYVVKLFVPERRAVEPASRPETSES